MARIFNPDMCKAIVEPVFGQIKVVRTGARDALRRSLDNGMRCTIYPYARICRGCSVRDAIHRQRDAVHIGTGYDVLAAARALGCQSQGLVDLIFVGLWLGRCQQYWLFPDGMDR
jgi:hypothetical protein